MVVFGSKDGPATFFSRCAPKALLTPEMQSTGILPSGKNAPVCISFIGERQ